MLKEYCSNFPVGQKHQRELSDDNVSVQKFPRVRQKILKLVCRQFRNEYDLFADSRLVAVMKQQLVVDNRLVAEKMYKMVRVDSRLVVVN